MTRLGYAVLATVFAAAPAAADSDRIGGGGYGHMWDGGWAFMGFGIMLLFWGLVVLVIVVGVKWLLQQDQPSKEDPATSALRTLEQRLANGEIDVAVSTDNISLRKGQAIAIDNSDIREAITVRVSTGDQSQTQFALLDGQAIKEPFVQQGPFVMGSTDEIEAINRAFDEGHFGSID